MIGKFFISRTGSDEYTGGMVNGKSFSVIAEIVAGEVVIGAEADFFRSRVNAAASDLLPGVQSVGGLAWCAPVGQIKEIENY
jgi:hypothetical protein